MTSRPLERGQGLLTTVKSKNKRDNEGGWVSKIVENCVASFMGNPPGPLTQLHIMCYVIFRKALEADNRITSEYSINFFSIVRSQFRKSKNYFFRKLFFVSLKG